MRVEDLMVKEVATIPQDTSIEQTIKTFYNKRLGSLIITDEEGKCKGILTHTDVFRAIIKKIPLDFSVEKVMSKNVITVSENDSFSEARELMCRHRIRHLPVTDRKGCVVGVLSIRHIFDEISGFKKHA